MKAKIKRLQSPVCEGSELIYTVGEEIPQDWLDWDGTLEIEDVWISQDGKMQASIRASRQAA